MNLLLATADPLLDCLTLVLALATVATAFMAVSAVRAANRATDSAEASAKEQHAIKILAVVADVPQDLFDDDANNDPKRRVLVPRDSDTLAITAPIRNVGPGRAFIVSIALKPANRSRRPEFDVAVPAVQTHRVLPPGETTIVACSIKRGEPTFSAFEEAVTTQFNILVRPSHRRLGLVR
jgi:hypothetical protein